LEKKRSQAKIGRKEKNEGGKRKTKAEREKRVLASRVPPQAYQQ